MLIAGSDDADPAADSAAAVDLFERAIQVQSQESPNQAELRLTSPLTDPAGSTQAHIKASIMDRYRMLFRLGSGATKERVLTILGIPEPGTMALAALGLAAMLLRRR
ncbi:MAG: PEP-CTERM sorting domain-containing protein [Bryobacteraceae bacterium]